MSVFVSTGEQQLKVNAWDWGVLHHLVHAGQVLPDEVWEPLRHEGGELDKNQVASVLAFLESMVLPCLRPGERIFFNGSITKTSDDGQLFREESEQWKNYSLHQEVLVRFIELLRGARGQVTFR